jgi:hypothetical protein
VRVYVEYQVPVLVEVDLDEGEVVAVCVEDEQVDGPRGVIVLDPGGLSTASTARAIAIAEGDSWPAWEFGT